MSGPHLIKHQLFPSRFLRNGQRDLIIYLPPGYHSQPHRQFPVLFLHDGQNLFDGATSFIPGMDRTWDRPRIISFLRVAWNPPYYCRNLQRWKAKTAGVHAHEDAQAWGGRASRYARFLTEEVRPFIEYNYRILGGSENTGIGGSSLGGLVSLFLGLRMPHIFGKIAALSPSVWWNQRVILRFAQTAQVDQRPRVWLDIGTCEGGRIVEDVERFRDILLTKGWRWDQDLHYERVEGAEHNEAAWAQRVGPFLQFLFPGG